ncbi:hypothetical protein Cgig2_009695 [Carnegiea gigantea]|uniref:Uncharacterized protein n=1 Tax=Carnegiea gigantea TaxID=171969 RepID=A0A9Q1QE52_9CARY|nr:hypothetical protein Cgig2_009695 [Carnegiea gigantea]
MEREKGLLYPCGRGQMMDRDSGHVGALLNLFVGPARVGLYVLWTDLKLFTDLNMCLESRQPRADLSPLAQRISGLDRGPLTLGLPAVGCRRLPLNQNIRDWGFLVGCDDTRIWVAHICPRRNRPKLRWAVNKWTIGHRKLVRRNIKRRRLQKLRPGMVTGAGSASMLHETVSVWARAAWAACCPEPLPRLFAVRPPRPERPPRAPRLRPWLPQFDG